MLSFMLSFKKSLFVFLGFLAIFISSSTLYSFQEILNKINASDYIFCIDGGASKTDLKILNKEGEELRLYETKDSEGSFKLQGSCTNISAYDEKDVQKALSLLIKGKYVGDERILTDSLISSSSLIAGFAGAGRETGKKSLLKIAQELGFSEDKIGIFSDAGIALELIQDNGGIVLGGTGSICFMKKDGVQFRLGGLGYRLGDEGSGYSIGIAGIKAAIENEHTPDDITSLTNPIKTLFNIQKATELIEIVNKNMMPPAQIASVAKIVFNEARNDDLIAKKIVKEAATEFGDLISKAVIKTETKNPMIYLIGGLFHCEQSEQFISDIIASPSMQELSLDQKPLLVNISSQMVPELAVREALHSKATRYYKPLASLPITTQSSSKEFKKKFQLGFISTEKQHTDATNLSYLFDEDTQEGLELLQRLDHSLLLGAEAFIENHLEEIHQQFLNKIQKKGRIFLVGSGSSGRIALDLAAKWRTFFAEKGEHLPSFLKDSIVGIIAGGPSAFVKAKEGFEDSIDAGYKSLENAGFTFNDTAILISASGSSSFNVGAAQYASQCGGDAYYFYNSIKVPERTASLFEEGLAKPILIDIGPQSITGSTRLQAAGLAELCWGAVLETIVEKLTYGDNLDAKKVGHKLLQNLQTSWEAVSEALPEIAKIVSLETKIFSSPEANFKKITDETKQGFITFIASDDSLREIMIDTTETAPTFSTNPPRNTKTEVGKKKAEFRAFLAGNIKNQEAWLNLIGQPLNDEDTEQTSHILLSSSEEGYGAYLNRIEAEGNLLIGVLKSSQKREKALELISELRMAKYRGLKVAAILIEEKKAPFKKEALQMSHFCDAFVLLRDIPNDYLGLTSTLTLKQALNLISNASMIKMNKVYGNTMIDVLPSNNKLVDRSIRIIQQIYSEHHPEEEMFDYETLFQFVTRAYQYKKLMEKQFSQYVPSSTKLVLTMLEKNYSVKEAVDYLKLTDENIHKIYQ